MNQAQPIRDRKKLQEFKDYYRLQEPNPRNYTLIILGLNTALRVSDLLSLRLEDVCIPQQHQIKEHLIIHEQKTHKKSIIYLNSTIQSTLKWYIPIVNPEYEQTRYLFDNNRDGHQAISRVQAYRIVKTAADACDIQGTISPHSLRKTFGYHAWKQGYPPALLMEIYQHLSYSVTKRYLGIEQDERDEIFRDIVM